MRAMVLVNAYIRSEGMIRQAERVAEELRLLGVDAEIVKNGSVLTQIRENAVADTQNYDFCVYLDKDKYLSRALERCGLRLFNCASAVEACDDKMLTALALAGCGVHLPDTVAAPLCYYKDARVSAEFLDLVESRLGYPLVAKKSFGSWGMDVRLISSRSELEKGAEEFKLFPHLFQRKVGKNGEDLRVIVVGGQAVACMQRRNEGDFRSNIEAGGKGFAVTPPPSFVQTAERCAEVLGLDYCGVDLLDEDGVPYVCEVNSNALFNEAEKVTGVNVAAAYALHMVTVMQGTKN